MAIKNVHKLVIKRYQKKNNRGKTTEIFIDGQRLYGVQSLNIDINSNDMAVVNLKLVVDLETVGEEMPENKSCGSVN